MPWTFFLTITNHTPRTLQLTSSHLSWGIWYLNNTDDRGPIEIGPNQTVQALGIRAASGTATGYECNCTWTDARAEGDDPWGTIDLLIDVPYSGSNRSSLTVNNPLKVQDWSDLPADGHDFSRSIVISVEGHALGAGSELQAQDDDDRRHAAFLAALRASNPNLRNLAEVLTLSQVEHFDPVSYLPPVAEMPPPKQLLARSTLLTLPRDSWSGFADPVFTTMRSRSIFVKEYQCLAAYAIASNPRAAVSLPASSTYDFKRRVEVDLFIRSLQQDTWSLKKSLSVEGTNPNQTAKVAASIESEFSVESVLEQSTTEISEEVIEQHFEAPSDHGILILPYVFSTIVLMYRVRKDEAMPPELMAVSEWAQFQLVKTYNLT
jgi:hypothetical protein